MSALSIRDEIGSEELRRRARRESDGRVSARLIAIANALEGMDRASAARLAGMDRQTLRDWVHRYNAEGIAGLCNRPAPGRKPKLTEGQMAALKAVVLANPIERHGWISETIAPDACVFRTTGEIVDTCCDAWNWLLGKPDAFDPVFVSLARRGHVNQVGDRAQRNPQPHARWWRALGVRGVALRISTAAIVGFRDDHRLRHVHALGQLLLGETGTGARLDHRRRQRELLLKSIVGLCVFRMLAPGGEGFLDRKSSSGSCHLLRTSPVSARFAPLVSCRICGAKAGRRPRSSSVASRRCDRRESGRLYGADGRFRSNWPR